MFEYIKFDKRDGLLNKGNLKLFGLSTCGFCKRAISFLEDNKIKFEFTYMDQIDPELKKRAKEEFSHKFEERLSFPGLVLNENDYQIGFIRVAWERMLDLGSMSIKTNKSPAIIHNQKIRDFVDKTAKYKNWYVNPDTDFRLKLEDGLEQNYNRYGYYQCPCRDTSPKDSNIVKCPCSYAETDINEWGQCFCGLYVSKDFSDSRTEVNSIPERRNKK